MRNTCYIIIYKYFSAIKGAKPCLAPLYDHVIVAYYSRNNKQLLLFFAACNSYYIIQYVKNKTLFKIKILNIYKKHGEKRS